MKRIWNYICCMLAIAALCAGQAVAKDALLEGEDYSISVRYNDKPCPGDAVFARMVISQNSRQSKKIKLALDKTTATLELYLGDKMLDKAEFYILENDSSRSSVTFLAGIPLSSWWNSDNSYSLKVCYKMTGAKTYEFALPFSLTYKKFVEETIPLDTKNTEIRTDTSPKRMGQIEKLNNILATINKGHIYQTKAYSAPTTATRRTSFFADRRIYAYSNGKSSTSLHYGTDYGVPTGSDVTACAAGRVVMAEDRVTTGWSVVIEHLPGLYSLYYHMSELKVKEGDMVKEGQLIGLSGATGLATGPHLHWEMRLNMAAVNPDFFTEDFTFSASN
ncbi:MAG: M23 family metallopeptidase [Treponema sp.]|nr:M23 family metallopeptidase [Treponema sp.]MCR5622568.1 M23 family metallopeptidase [Treponema sp.]